MKLKVFNTVNLPRTKTTTHPLIGISQKSGSFRINQAACEKLSLKAGDKIQLVQNEDEPETWFLETATDGFELRQKENISPKGLIFQSSVLAREIFKSVKCDALSGHLKIGETIKFEKRKLVTLITASLNANY